jgi:hypothetical protein
MIKFFVLFISVSCWISCASDSPKQKEPTLGPTASPSPLDQEVDPNEPFYPYVEYIQQQTAHIDTTPYPIEKLIYINEKLVDSAYISKEEFKNWVSGFIEINPNETKRKPLFKESSLQDLTLNRVIFSITAKEPNSALLQADVSVNPQNDKVKTIILKKQTGNKDSTAIQHLVWVDGKHLQISENISPKNKAPYVKVIKITWEKDPE